MSTAQLEKLIAPAVEQSLTRAATAIHVRETPFAPVAVDVDLPAAGLADPPKPGDPIRIKAGTLTIEAHARMARRVRTTGGEGVTVPGVMRPEPWDHRAVCFRQKKRSFCLRALLPGTPLVSKAGPVGDEPRAWQTHLTGPSWPAAGRMALLGGQILLNTAAGAVLVRPDQPGTPTALPGPAFFTVDAAAVPGLTLIAPDPKAWGKVLTKTWGPGCPGAEKLTLHLNEAVSAAELGAAGAALRAVIGLGAFEAHGGPELLAIGPGDWVSHPSGSVHLVTGRTLTWTRAAGWRVELIGGYPLAGLLPEPAPAAEEAEVTGYDSETGRLVVRLPGHEGVTFGAFVRADRGKADSYRLTVPAVGECGTVQFAGPNRGVYVGAVAPDGVLTKDDFDKAVELVRTPGSAVRHLNDGTVEFTWKSFRVVCQKAMEHVASLFKFNKG